MSPAPCFDTHTCPVCGGVGSDENAHFWCDCCHGSGSVLARLSCYEVVSPETCEYGGGYSPDEYGSCWGLFVARNARVARVMAVKSKDFASWVDEARGDGVPPFKGLTVRLARCEHGVCWGCQATEESSGCPECDKEET